jgi:putative transposase
MKRAFSKGSYIHITKRGVRGLPIVKDASDKWRFVRLLRYLNDQRSHANWQRDVKQAGAEGYYMPWPENWQSQNKLVHIHAYTLMPNHFHLLIEEIVDGGTARFMKKIGDSMTKSFNKKYDEQGGLFQGPYNSSIIESDDYLRFVMAYIEVKNVFELYPDGFSVASANFKKGISWAKQYPFSSLAYELNERKNSPIIDRNQHTADLFNDADDFKWVAKEAIQYSQTRSVVGTDIHLE